ncbi:hypothetical protein D3C74_175270 [compost metagenome]
MEFRIRDTKTGKEVPVAKLECNPRTGVIEYAVGFDYNDPETDYYGTVVVGGYLSKMTRDANGPLRKRYILLVDGVPVEQVSA